jgi:hypothetical protein
LFVGVAIVAASALLGAMLLRGEGTGAAVWAARTPLAEGQTVTGKDLVRRSVEFTEQSLADRYLSADQPLPEPVTLTRAVGEGELLPRAALVTGAEGRLVRVPLAVPRTGLPPATGEGSVVDVWVIPGPEAVPAGDAVSPGTGTDAVRVFTGVSVLHLSRAAGALGAGVDTRVVVGVDSGQQDSLPRALAAMSRGTVVLTSGR